MSNKGATVGIYFSPVWLYAEAEKYGRQLERAESASAVVCAFVRQGLTSAGWELPAEDKPRRVLVSADTARLVGELRRLGGCPETALRQAIAAMEDPVIAPAPTSR